MAKPLVPPALLKAITGALAAPVDGKRKEAPPKDSLTAKESIRPARTSIAHQRGGNKGK